MFKEYLMAFDVTCNNGKRESLVRMFYTCSMTQVL